MNDPYQKMMSSKIKKSTDYFYFQRGSVSTLKPWGRPTYNKVKELSKELKSTTNLFSKYEIYIYGGCLYNMSKTWDLDLFFIGDSTNNIQLEKDMNIIYDLAFNKYRLLCDIQWLKEHVDGFTDTTCKKTAYIVKQINEDVMIHDQRIINLNYNPKSIRSFAINTKLLTEYLIEQEYTHTKHIKASFVNDGLKLKHDFNLELLLTTDEEYYKKNTNWGAKTSKEWFLKHATSSSSSTKQEN